MLNAGKRELLILRRRQALKSQYEVAVELGISQSSYSMIENGFGNPKDDGKEKLIAMFGLDPDYFDADEREDGSVRE